MRKSIWPLLLIFFLSGAAALIYEVLWTRQLSLIFGVTTYAVSAVLATYMGGLALGSYLIGKIGDRVRSPLLTYAALEAAIGLYALLVPFLLGSLRPLYIEVARAGLPYTAFSAVRLLLAALVLLVPTTLMGGTYPVLMRHWARQRQDIGTGAGVLYFVNTAGAITGCFMAGFDLIEQFGLRGTNFIAAGANLALAACAAAASMGSFADVRQESEIARDRQAPLSAATSSLVLLTIGISGFVSLCAQVLWTRALLRYLYNSTYAFTSMLAVFLLGITIGSFLLTMRLRNTRDPLRLFAHLQIAGALGLLAALLVFPRLLDLQAFVFGNSAVDSFERSVRMMLLSAAATLLPFVLFLGASFPLATYLFVRGREDVGRASGMVYASNTLGAILGSLGCTFVLIPVLGMLGTERLLVLITLASGAALVAGTKRDATRALTMSTTVVIAIATFFVPAGDPFRETFLRNPHAQLAFYEEGSTDTVGVEEVNGQRIIVYEDLRGTAATSTYGYNFFFGHLPILLHPGTPKKVLHICFGVGNSLSAVASHVEVERVDNVELSPHILHAGRMFWTNDDVLQNPKVHTIIDDGRNFMMTSSEKYDVILLEPPEPFTAGVINLYTTEFYQEALERLAPEGILLQWIPTANAPLNEEREMFRSFHDVFPHATMWWQLQGASALLVGTRERLSIDYARLQRHFLEPRVAQDMELSMVKGVDHFLAHMIFDEEAFADFVRGARPITDDNTVLDFSMPRYGGSGFGLGQFSTQARQSANGPAHYVQERKAWYFAHRRSPAPYLFHFGEEVPEAVNGRIVAAAALRTFPRPLGEKEWQDLRRIASGTSLLPAVSRSSAH